MQSSNNFLCLHELIVWQAGDQALSVSGGRRLTQIMMLRIYPSGYGTPDL
jgi:hypothetical protein